LKKLLPIGLSILSGLLMWGAWPVSLLSFLIFLGFIPLLLNADTLTKKASFFWHVFIGILIWNVGTTWWIWNSTDVGSVAAIIANSLLMCLPWWGYFALKTGWENSWDILH